MSPALATLAAAALSAVLAAMEDPANPLLLMETSEGDIYLELLPAEAPLNVANVLAFAAGEVELEDPDSGRGLRAPYYDGTRFHRVLPGFIVQAASPLLHPIGMPRPRYRSLQDEINADSLGLQHEPALLANGDFNPLLGIGGQEDLTETLLRPLYQQMDIESLRDLQDSQPEVIQRLRGMSVKQALENRGFRFTDAHPTRPLSRGTVALANNGPDANGPEFFIALRDAPSLGGRHTVVGRVAAGMEVADSIGRFTVQPQDTRFSTVIYRLRRVN